MRLIVTELRDDMVLSYNSNNNQYNNSGSEDEDGAALFVAQVEEELVNAEGASLHHQGASLHPALEQQRNRGTSSQSPEP